MQLVPCSEDKPLSPGAWTPPIPAPRSRFVEERMAQSGIFFNFSNKESNCLQLEHFTYPFPVQLSTLLPRIRKLCHILALLLLLALVKSPDTLSFVSLSSETPFKERWRITPALKQSISKYYCVTRQKADNVCFLHRPQCGH